MELNAKDIIQAMKCCYTDEDNCLNCPYMNDYDSCVGLSKNALALIKQLTEENERLRTPTYMLREDGGVELMPTIESVRADTVREMQSEIKDRCIKGGIYPAFVARTIDQIAKEMLEDNQ